MRVQGPVVAGGLLDEEFSGLRDVVSIKFVGLITCERCCVDKGVRLLLFSGSAQGFKLELVHMEVEGEDQENEVEERKDGEECEVEVYRDNDDTMRMTNAMTCAQHLELEPVSM